MKVSILLLTYNEEANLPRCLDALQWCDDIIVVDSGSTDRTVEIAQAAGAGILFRPFDNFANQRNFGLDNGAPGHEWVLHLDADEVATPEFRRCIETLAPAEGIDAYRIPSKIIMLGHWLRHAGMYPAYQVRLGHRDRLRFKQVGHGQREDLPPSRLGTLHEPYLHYNFSHGLENWLRKHVKYAADEARHLAALRVRSAAASGRLVGGDGTDRRRLAKDMAARMPLFLRPVARFFYVYFWRRGFLDGRYGFFYACMLSLYEGMIAILTVEELSRQRNQVVDHHQGEQIQARVFSPRGTLEPMLSGAAKISAFFSPEARPDHRVSSVVFLGWLLVFLGYEWLRFKYFTLGLPKDFDQALNFISAVECMEIVVLLRLLAAAAKASGPTPAEAFATLGGLAGVLFLSSDKPLLGAAAISAYVLVKYWKRPAARAFAIAQFLFVMQYVAQGWPFLVFHNLVGVLDAGVIRAGARSMGLDVSGYGTFIVRPSINIVFDVMWGCATSTALAMVIPGFLIAVLGLRGRFERRDLLWLAALIGVTTIANWARLLLIVRSLAAHSYWHDGDGAQIFAFFYALLIVGFAIAATRERTVAVAKT